MANTPVTIEGAVATVGFLVDPPFATTDNYTFSFPYLNQTDFEIEVRDTILETTDYEFTSDYLINLTAAGVSKLNGLFGDLDTVPVIIRRRTESGNRLVDFINNSTLTDVELDLQSDQLFYLIQEVYDNANLGGVNFNPVSNDIDIEGAELLDIGYPLSENSAANLASILDNVVVPDYTEGDTYRSGRFVMSGDDLYRANKDIDVAPAVLELADFDLIIDASELAKIAGMESNITTNTADIATNVTDIATNTGNISTNTGNISGNSLNITSNYNAITDLDVRVTTNEGDILTNVSDISSNATGIMDNALDISNHIAEDVTAHTQVGTYSEIGVWANTAADGAQAYATDAEKYYYVVDGGLIEMGAGAATAEGVGSLDTIYSQSFEDSLIGDFGTSTATGTFEGTLSFEETDPLNGDTSLKYVQASGSGSDYFYMGSSVLSGIDIPLKAQNDRILLKFASSYTGNSGDMRVRIIDTTSLSDITDAVLDIKNGVNTNKLYINLDDVSRITIRFEVVTEDIGAELVIDDLELIANPDKEISVSRVVGSVSRDGNDSRAITAGAESIPFGAGTDSSSGWTYGANGSSFTNGNYYTVQTSNSVVSLSGSVRTSTGATGQSIFIIVDGVQYRRIGFEGSSGASLVAFEFTSEEGEFTKGQKLALSLGVDGTLQNLDRDHFLTIVETEYSPNVMVSGTKSTYAYVEARGNAGQSITANVTDIPFIATDDEKGLWDGSGFTADRDMIVSVMVGVRLDVSDTLTIDSYINGDSDKALGARNTLSNQGGSSMFKLKSGDRLSLRLSASADLGVGTIDHWITIKELPNYEDLILAYLEESQAATAGVERRTGRSLNGKPIYEMYVEVTSDISSLTTLVTLDSSLTMLGAIGIGSNDYIIQSFTVGDSNYSLVAYNSSTGIVRGDAGGAYTLTAGTTIKLEYTK